MQSQEEMIDILIPRKDEVTALTWAFRTVSPKLANKKIPKPTPESHKKAVLDSPTINDLLLQLSFQQNLPQSELREQVRTILDEIGYEKNLRLIRWLGVVLAKILLQISSGLCVNEVAILKVKDAMGSCPVVLVPSHRSYADFILMSYVLFHYDIVIPAITAGMDFQSMAVIGTMLRHTGAFYMRRTYNSDSLYWKTFKEYIHQLVVRGDLPIEFFIEGTRSRSGKSLVPKFGFMNMILKAFFLSEVPDILFVPVSISYERVLEEKLFAFELLGVPKPKESTSGFFKSLCILKESFGKTYFNFSTPISAKEYFGEKLNRSVHNISPVYQQDITEYEKSLVPSLAYDIVSKQQKKSVLTVFNIIAIIMDHNWTKGNTDISMKELTREISWLKSILTHYGAPIDIHNIENDVLRTLVVHKNLLEVNGSGKIMVVRNVVPASYEVANLKGHSLSAQTMTNCVPYIMLQIYINPVMHYLVDSALITLILKEEVCCADQLYENYCILRNLLSHEFVSPKCDYVKNYEDSLRIIEYFDVINRKNRFPELGTNIKLQEYLSGLVQPFIDSYYMVVHMFHQYKILEEKSLFVAVQKHFEIMLNSKESKKIHPYCLSLDVVSNCLSYLVLYGHLLKRKVETSTVYEVINTMDHIVQKLDLYKTKEITLPMAVDKVSIKSKL